jgi:hypothetical protein
MGQRRELIVIVASQTPGLAAPAFPVCLCRGMVRLI